MFEFFSNRKVFIGFKLGLLAVLLSFSHYGYSASSSYIDYNRVIYERPSPSKQLELIDCFKNGICTEEDKIRIYPMPCEGSGSNDCTGCYRLQGGNPIRINDLNSSGDCSGVGNANEQKLRVFVGYEQKCPSGTPVGTPCSDGQLFLSCSVRSENADAGGETVSYDRDCFAGRPYVRRAAAGGVVIVTPTIMPTGPLGCAPGTTGDYPNCIPCSNTSYKPTTGNAACTECVSPAIANSTGVIYSTAGSTKSSVNDCEVSDFSCASGYIRNFTNQTCDLPPVVPIPDPTSTPTQSSTPAPSSTPMIIPTCADVQMNVQLADAKETTSPPSTTLGKRRWLIRINAFHANVPYLPTDFIGIHYYSENRLTCGGCTVYPGSGFEIPYSLTQGGFINLSAADYYFRVIYSIYGVLCTPTSYIHVKVP